MLQECTHRQVNLSDVVNLNLCSGVLIAVVIDQVIDDLGVV